MRSSLVFARKEASEILHTWRIYVLPAILGLFAITGPALAKFTPQLVTAVAGSQFANLQLPDPTALDAYGQWIKNLGQIGAFALIIIYGGIVSAERRSGTAILVLTKPVSRTAFVIVKAVVHALFVTAILLVCTAITWAMTAIVFGQAPPGPLWSSALVWLVLALLYLGLMTLFSVLIPSGAGAAGAGLGAYLLLSIASAWQPAVQYSPAGLLGGATALAADADAGSLVWPVITGLVVAVVAVVAAAARFRRLEL